MSLYKSRRSDYVGDMLLLSIHENQHRTRMAKVYRAWIKESTEPVYPVELYLFGCYITTLFITSEEYGQNVADDWVYTREGD